MASFNPAADFGVIILRRPRLEDEFSKEYLPCYIGTMEHVPTGLLPRLTAVRAGALLLVGLALLVAGFVYATGENSTVGLRLFASPFDEERAFEELKQFTQLGPRPPGSDMHDWAYLLIHLGLLGAGVDVHNVSFNNFEASTPVGKIHMTNVVAKIPGAQPDTIILGGHYDTKRMELRFVGANDGGSSTAFLIEMAQVLAHLCSDGLDPRNGIEAIGACRGVPLQNGRTWRGNPDHTPVGLQAGHRHNHRNLWRRHVVVWRLWGFSGSCRMP